MMRLVQLLRTSIGTQGTLQGAEIQRSPFCDPSKRPAIHFVDRAIDSSMYVKVREYHHR